MLLVLIRRLRDERPILGFAAFYLVRDLILYGFIPLAILAGLFR